jgi:soluble lytic murein transglycosylase-like protein
MTAHLQPAAPRHAPAAWLVRAAFVMGLGIAAGLAQAQSQVYASAPNADLQEALVLSNFASEQTPVLLLDRPVSPAQPVAPTPRASEFPPAAAMASTPAPTPGAASGQHRRAPTPPAGWLPLFASVAREHAVPAGLLLAVAAAESGFNPRARSPKGALGLMQLMPGTARDRGVRAIWSVADNLRGGAAHLRLLLNRFAGRPDLAIAAYNAGEQAVINAGSAVPDFGETQRYVPKVLAWHAEYESMMSRDRSWLEPRRSAGTAAVLRLAGTP